MQGSALFLHEGGVLYFTAHLGIHYLLSSPFIRRVAKNEVIHFWNVLDMLRDGVPASFCVCVCVSTFFASVYFEPVARQ